MTIHKNKSALPQLNNENSILQILSLDQFKKRASHFIYRAKKGETFLVKDGEDSFLIQRIEKL